MSSKAYLNTFPIIDFKWVYFEKINLVRKPLSNMILQLVCSLRIQ